MKWGFGLCVCWGGGGNNLLSIRIVITGNRGIGTYVVGTSLTNATV